jgi:hypothetical protein
VPHRWLILLLLLLLPSVASAQSKWTLTTADFRSKQVDLTSIDDKGATFADRSSIRFDDLLLLDRDADLKQQSQPAAGGKFILYLSGGDQFRGEPAKLEGETLYWSSPAVGEMQVPLRQVTSLVRATPQTSSQQQQQQPASDERRTEDVITLANGDVVRGIVANISNEAVTAQSGGNETPVPIDGIRSIAFASTAGASPKSSPQQQSGRSFRIKLEDGSILTAPQLRTTANDTLVVTLADKSTRNVPLSSVATIEQLNGPVTWLSSRTPSENVQTPLLDTTRPARMDRTVTGKPIRFGERTYARGIGVAPYSRITWPIDQKTRGDYQTFRTQYALDGAGQYADVTVRVKLDGKVVHERQKLTAGELSPVVLVPLGNAKTLMLEVDFGGNYGVQDRFNWIEPALVKGSGAPPPPPPSATTAATKPAPPAQ